MQAIKLYRSKSVALGWTEGVCQSIQSKCPELSAQAQFAFGVCATGVATYSALLSCSPDALGWRPVVREFALNSSRSISDVVDL